MTAPRWGVEWRGRVYEFPSLNAALHWVDRSEPPLRFVYMDESRGEWVAVGAN